ncbi:MAG TPA: MBL fold metallo-hydrolase [Desulfobacteraceae bacterium]|nr:MBL fold metallo-hydrolase [Desulfobacteraceae bacterium]
MRVQQFKYSADNLGYLVYGPRTGIAIDAGAVDKILAFAQENRIEIAHVTNTHSHYDHTPGNQALLEKTDARFIDCRAITDDRTLSLDGETLEMFPTPGHTADCVTFKGDDFLITGDTLFNGTVGNCFSGDLHAFFISIKRLIALPGSTKIYAGHDYVEESIAFARTIETKNPHMEEYLKKYDPALVVSTLADELKVNPYLRFNTQDMIDNLKQKNMPVDTEFHRFKSIMEVY